MAATPILEFRDARTTVNFESRRGNPRWRMTAIDDGGVRMFRTGQEVTNVALLEAKRRFQDIGDGKPTVSDDLLAQMVGQALTSCVDIGGCEAVSRKKQVAFSLIQVGLQEVIC